MRPFLIFINEITVVIFGIDLAFLLVFALFYTVVVYVAATVTTKRFAPKLTSSYFVTFVVLYKAQRKPDAQFLSYLHLSSFMPFWSELLENVFSILVNELRNGC